MDLVVLAAGLGDRFGGPKQLAAVGPDGEAILDYTLFDAARAGFSRASIVVRSDMDPEFRQHVAKRHRGRIEVRTVHQETAQSPLGAAQSGGRRRPWGTGHAVLAAGAAVGGPFAVVNADDFYGAEAFEVAASFLRRGPEERADAPLTWALVGYRLGETLSAAGSVNRALCRLDGSGRQDHVLDIEERAFTPEDAKRDPLALVSMNFWCLDENVFPLLRRGFAAFVARADREDDEYRLPDAVRALLSERQVRVRALRHDGRWFGLTHPADRATAQAELLRLVEEGRYPSPLVHVTRAGRDPGSDSG